MFEQNGFIRVLTLVLVCLSFGFLVLTVFGPELGEFQQRSADTINGFLMGSVLSTIVGTFYGTSLGSKDKQVIIDRVLDKVADNMPGRNKGD